MATTEDLRATLMDTLEQVRQGKMDSKDATTVCKIADKIIATARLEIDFALACSTLDKQGQDISPGPMLLTDESKNRS